MSRSRRRISRALLGLLACTIALGLVFWLHNLNKTRAAAAASAAAASAGVVAPPPAGDVAPSDPAPAKPSTDPAQNVALVTQTPTGSAQSARTDSGSQTRQPAPAPGSISITPSSATTRPAGAAPNQFASSIVIKPGAPKPAAAIHSAQPLVDAKAKIDAGDFLTARTILNTALLDNNLSPADAAIAKKVLAHVNESIVFSPRKFNDDEYATSYTVQRGDVLAKIAASNDVNWELLCRLNGISRPETVQAGRTLKIVRGPFHAVVDKSEFTMEIYLGSPGQPGSLFVTSFPVGLGADDSTPAGTWTPQERILNPTYFSPRGGGVIDADDPENPLGECWIGLTGIDGQAVGKESYGIHGTIEPDSIGKQASMGCIRMRNEDVELVFDLMTEGKSVVVVRE